MSQRSLPLILAQPPRLNVRRRPIRAPILRIREPSLAHLHWFLPLLCARVGSDCESWRMRACEGRWGGWTSHPFSFRRFGHPHLHWSCDQDAYMRKQNPHGLPRQKLPTGGYSECKPKWEKQRCYSLHKHQGAVAVFTARAWTWPQLCVCVRKRSSAASSPPQSSVLKSLFKSLYENSSCFQTDLFWEIGCLASLIFSPPLFSLLSWWGFWEDRGNIGKLLRLI